MPQSKERSRLWNLVLWPDNDAHATALDLIRRNYHYVAICHDRDPKDDGSGDLKKPHYHVILKFTQARWNTAIATDLGIDIQYMQKTGSFDKSGAYLLHEGFDDKYQYLLSDLEGDLAPAVAKVLADDTEDERVIKLLKLLDEVWTPLTVKEFVMLACENGLYGDLRRMGHLAVKLLEEHNNHCSIDKFGLYDDNSRKCR